MTDNLEEERAIRAIDRMMSAPSPPMTGKKFKLALEGDGNPMRLLRNLEYKNPELWRYHGAILIPGVTEWFTIVEVDYSRDWAALIEQLRSKEGTIPEVQWILSLALKFPGPTEEVVGIANDSLEHPHGDRYFPLAGDLGRLRMRTTSGDFRPNIRWLLKI